MFDINEWGLADRGLLKFRDGLDVPGPGARRGSERAGDRYLEFPGLYRRNLQAQ
jgi:hypothetical protein